MATRLLLDVWPSSRDGPPGGDRRWPRCPGPTRTRAPNRSPPTRPLAPRLGPLLEADTYYVLTEVMGLDDDEVAEYAAAGAIE